MTVETLVSEVKKRPANRLYPRRHLRGSVETIHSSRLKFPKYHMVHDCDGLERTPQEARASSVFADARALGLSLQGRPCRNCTLESVLITTLKPVKSEGLVFVTATSQGNPLDAGVNINNYAWAESSQSGKARLLRVARKVKLDVALTVVGPVMSGFVPESGAKILAHNLRTVIRHDVDELPAADVIESFWSFLGDNPPELGHPQDFDAWETALALA